MSKDSLNLVQSKANPYLFYEKNTSGALIGVIVVYVDDCILTGEKEFIARMKTKLEEECGVVEDWKTKEVIGSKI